MNLLDTPGYPDFTGELRAGLRAADAALFVVSAAEDIDPITSTLWEECAALGTPRAVVMTRLDTPRASFDDSVAACQRVFGGADGQDVLPLYLPVEHEPETAPEALVGLLSRRVYDYASGFPPKVSDLTDDVAVAGDVEQARNALIEAIINNSEDESLLDRYLAGEDIGVDVLIDDLETAVARGTFYPVVPVCSGTGLGLGELLGDHQRRLPVAGRTRPAGRHHRNRRPGQTDPVRPSRTAGGRGHPYLGRPLPGPAVHPADLLRHADSGQRNPCLRTRGRRRAGILTTTRTSGSASSSHRSAPRCVRSTGRLPVTSARSAASPLPRPATPCRTRPRRY